MVTATCTRCGYRAILTSAALTDYAHAFHQHGTRPWKRVLRWPLRCCQRWMAFLASDANT